MQLRSMVSYQKQRHSLTSTSAHWQQLTTPALPSHRTRWDWYCDTDSIVASALKALLTGFLPSLLVLLWQSMALPRLIFLCAQGEGRHMSLSNLDRRMAEVYL